MYVKNIEEKKIHGISIRTTNASEMNPATGKIGPLWQKFDKNVEIDYKSGNRVYGVYYNYESDASGEFTVLAGTDQINLTSSTNLQTITIPSGTYLVFKANGQMPEIVIETWVKIWDYFSKKNTEHQRLYATDFEYYVHSNEIEIYIGIK